MLGMVDYQNIFHRRIDTDFWTLVSRYEERVAVLQAQYSEADVSWRLNQLRREDLRVIDALVAGRHPPTLKELRDVVKEYPYLACALLEDRIGNIRQRAKDRLEEAQRYWDLVQTFSVDAAPPKGIE